jgi:GNAT superfamily N-acetyltransferase
LKRALGDGFELDDDSRRIDRAAVHRFLTAEAYWARGRSREVQDALIDGSQRVVGLYRDGELVGFSRTVSDGHVHAYLADVFVLPDARGRGLGVELVRFSVEEGPYAGCRWLLHTEDAHALYAKFGFDPPGATLLERPRRAVRRADG